MAVRLVGEDELSIISSAQLLVCVQKLDARDAAIRREVDIDIVTDAYRFHLARDGAKAKIRNVSARIIGQAHRNLSEETDNHRYHDPPIFLIDGVDLKLLHSVPSAAQLSVISKITAKACTAVLPRKPFTPFDRRSYFPFVRAAFEHSLPRVRLDDDLRHDGSNSPYSAACT